MSRFLIFRRLSATLMIFSAVTLLHGFAGAQLGEKVAGFRLVDTADKTHTMSEYAGKILILEFWSFKCPVAQVYNDRVKALQSKYAPRGVVLLAVASNRNESPLEVRRNAENLSLPFPVLLDQDGVLADRVGVSQTPSVVILDGAGILRYRGAIDNNRRVTEPGRIAYVEEAVDALLAGRPVARAETPVSGCAIRR